MASLEGFPVPPTVLLPEHVEPTFVFGGQPYVFDGDELSKAGPEFISHALAETSDRLFRLQVHHHAHVPIPEDNRLLSREEFIHRATELAAGLAALSALAVPILPYARHVVKGMGMVLGTATGIALFVD